MPQYFFSVKMFIHFYKSNANFIVFFENSINHNAPSPHPSSVCSQPRQIRRLLPKLPIPAGFTCLPRCSQTYTHATLLLVSWRLPPKKKHVLTT